MTEIDWLQDGTPLTVDTVIVSPMTVRRRKGNRLQFAHPSDEESGTYACKASNAAGSVTSTNNFTLHVPLPGDRRHGMRISRRKRGGSAGGQAEHVTHELQAKETEPAWLACEVGKKKQQQHPQQHGASVKWFKDGKLLRNATLAGAHSGPAEPTTETLLVSDNGRPREDCKSESRLPILSYSKMMFCSENTARIIVNPRNATLHFTGVYASDTGLYECHLYNAHASQIAHKRTALRVIEQLRFVPQPTSKNIELGTLAKVHCKVQGTPTPTVSWYKNGKPLPDVDASGAPATIEDINGTLVFRNASAADRGNYTCEATSSQGRITADIHIGVVVAPRFSVAPEAPAQPVEIGTSVWLHCQATGDPMPTVKWDKDLVVLDDAQSLAAAESESASSAPGSRYRVLANGTLYIADVHADDEAQYGCTIGSSAGLKREEVRMTVRSIDDYAAAAADGSSPTTSGEGFMITRAVLITMSVAFAYIVLVVGLMLWCRFRRQARKARLNLLDKDAVENGGTGGNGDLKLCEIEPCLPADKLAATSAGKLNGAAGKKGRSGDGADSGNNDTAASGNSKVSKRSASTFEEITLPRAALSELVLVGQGDFGDVFVGKIRARDVRTVTAAAADAAYEKSKSKQSLNEINEITNSSTTAAAADATTGGDQQPAREVLVKALSRVKDEAIGIEFRRQIEMFRAVSHRNVCQLFGLVRDKDPHLLVLEHSDAGDLKRFLLDGGAATSTLDTVQLLQWAWQIGRGMDAIYRARYIHKDLAARNCCVNSALEVKISYAGLNHAAAAGDSGANKTDAAYAPEYWRHNNALVPLRWLAPECLHDDDYSTKSDVYAFAVLAWELFSAVAGAEAAPTAALLPLAELENEEFLRRLRDGSLERKLAPGTPAELGAVLVSARSERERDELVEFLVLNIFFSFSQTSCWSSNPKERPSFHTLHTTIANCLQAEKEKGKKATK